MYRTVDISSAPRCLTIEILILWWRRVFPPCSRRRGGGLCLCSPQGLEAPSASGSARCHLPRGVVFRDCATVGDSAPSRSSLPLRVSPARRAGRGVKPWSRANLLPPQEGVATAGRGGESSRGRDKGLTPSASLRAAPPPVRGGKEFSDFGLRPPRFARTSP